MSGLLVKTNNSIRENLWRYFIVAIPYIWLLLFFLAPFVIVFKISLADPIIAQPPFTPFFNQGSDGGFSIYTTFDNFLYLFQDSLYFVTYLNSVKLAFIATLFTLLIGYPIAYGIARSPQPTRNILLLLVVIPFWISFLLRVYSWMGILKTNGLINGFLLWWASSINPRASIYRYRCIHWYGLFIPPIYDTSALCEPGKLDEAAKQLQTWVQKNGKGFWMSLCHCQCQESLQGAYWYSYQRSVNMLYLPSWR